MLIKTPGPTMQMHPSMHVLGSRMLDLRRSRRNPSGYWTRRSADRGRAAGFRLRDGLLGGLGLFDLLAYRPVTNWTGAIVEAEASEVALQSPDDTVSIPCTVVVSPTTLGIG